MIEAATHYAHQVDELFSVLLALSLFFAVGIAACVLFFTFRYRRGRPANRSGGRRYQTIIEVTWIIIPTGLGLAVFVWAALLFLSQQVQPPAATTVYVMGQQWMWKIQHPEGRREIDELHVPRGRTVRLLMTSQDVIHSFFVPAFRLKQDVLPGRYTSLSFTAEKTGKYHLFCAEYCGTDHAGMGGWVYVMEPADYEAWLAKGPTGTMAMQGHDAFIRNGCNGCHRPQGQGPCPDLAGLFGKRVPLADGTFVTFDEGYIHESILEPSAKVAAGYPPIMPSFKGQIGEEEIMRITVYLQSLAAENPQ